MVRPPSARDIAAVRDAVVAFNVARTGCDDDTDLGAVLRDEQGDLVAGLAGWTWGGFGKIEWLFVREDRRHTGLGSRLVAAAEAEAARRGCVAMRVDTHSFQAPGFYARLGYEVIGVADDTPVGHREFFCAKRLEPGA